MKPSEILTAAHSNVGSQAARNQPLDTCAAFWGTPYTAREQVTDAQEFFTKGLGISMIPIWDAQPGRTHKDAEAAFERAILAAKAAESKME